jgi:NAD dependent epimerase/dehydratase family enzyme
MVPTRYRQISTVKKAKMKIGSILHKRMASEELLTGEVSGAVNLTAPNPVTNAEFTSTLARTVKRLAILPIPPFAPKALLGDELADALLFTGQRVIPAALNASGYKFVHPTLEVALRALLKK